LRERTGQFSGEPNSGTTIAESDLDDDVIAAVLSARSSYRFNPQWSIDLTADAWPGSDDSYHNVASMVRYRVIGQVRYSFY
jgi:hypothetical protein